MIPQHKLVQTAKQAVFIFYALKINIKWIKAYLP